MRISDWSSDVCSSDLDPHPSAPLPETNQRTAIISKGTLEVRQDRQILVFVRENWTGGGQRPVNADLRTIPMHPAVAFRCVIIGRSEEHTSELQSLMRISYAVFCLTKNNRKKTMNNIRCNMNP